MRLSFVTVGVWWIGFSQISFAYLPDYPKERGKINKNILLGGFKELQKVWQQLSNSPHLKWYLAAFFMYSMGVQTVMLIATYFGGEEIEWENIEQSTIGLIVSVLLIQLVAILGARLTVMVVKYWGNVRVLIGLNAIWIAICIASYWVFKPTEFYILAAVVGLVMGGIQTLSRSTYSAYLPTTTDTTSFFSFYDVTEKLGIVIGMGVYGMIDQFTNNMRNATLSLMLFFAIGMSLLFKVLFIKNKK